jgi:hypothetical protein
MITQTYLRERLDYDPETGIFRWKAWSGARPNWNAKHAGKVAGWVQDYGRIKIRLNGREEMAHRLAWIYMHGHLDRHILVDHEDRNPSNNKISNLRLATHSENNENREFKLSACGERYIRWLEKKKRFIVSIHTSSMIKRVSVGYYKTLQEAVEARDKFLSKL